MKLQIIATFRPLGLHQTNDLQLKKLTNNDRQNDEWPFRDKQKQNFLYYILLYIPLLLLYSLYRGDEFTLHPVAEVTIDEEESHQREAWSKHQPHTKAGKTYI